MGEVDPAFIQSTEQRPNLVPVEGEGIPLIDLSVLNSLLDRGNLPSSNSAGSSADLEALAAEIGGACKDWGFFQVINHGVSLDCRRKIEEASRRFFAQSGEEKRKVGRDEEKPMGYYDSEHTKNVRDWKEVFDFVTQSNKKGPDSHDPDDEAPLKALVNQWPQYPPNFREACEEYVGEVEKLAFKVLELISLSLGLSANRLNGFFQVQTSFVRLNYYPPCPVPHLALGVGRHKDAGALTVLAQDDVGGLQVKRKLDDKWVTVRPTPNAYIINVGDIVQVWSNDQYQSVEHRVTVNSEKERFSVPFFFNPGHHVMVEPLKELITEQHPPRYDAFNWGDFLITRSVSNFKKLDADNLQIHHYQKR